MSKSRIITELFAKAHRDDSDGSAAKNESIVESENPDHPVTSASPSNSNKESTAIAVRDKACHPGKNFKFPKTKFGSRERSCQSSWFDS